MVEPAARLSAAAADATLANLRVVLVRPRGAANVGAAARAMRNLGAGDLVLVRPAMRLAAAERMAVHARDLVRGARVVDDIGAAVADCGLVVGTTCRRGGYRTDAEAVDAMAPALLAQARLGPVAVLFGPEDHGLSNEDLRFCQRLCTIDTSDAYASLNLAQAVLLICWELRRAALAAAADAAAGDEAAVAAPAAAVQAMCDHLQAALLRIGFLHPQNPEHIMYALRGLFGRAVLREPEVRLLRGIARQMEWAARQGGEGGAAPGA